MDGTVGLSLQLAVASSAQRGRLELRAGEILSLRVGESLGKNRYEISLRGMSLVVRSRLPLPSGTVLHAKVLLTGKRIELKILDTAAALRSNAPPPAAPLPSAGDPAAVLIQAMQRTGLPVTASSMNAIRAMLPPERRTNPAYVRLATILFDKHLHLDPERLEELYLTINGRPHGESGGGSGSRHGGGTGGRDPQQRGDMGGRGPQQGGGAPSTAGAAEEEARASEAPSGALEASLEKGLRAQSSARGTAAVGWPALINHPVGDHESWVVVPFSLSAGETSVDGTIRLLITPPASRSLASGARLPVSRAVVVVPEVGAFEISGAPPRRVGFYADNEAMHRRVTSLLPKLREKLRNLGVEIDDTNNGGAVFDGFSAETIEIRGVDATV